jgi:hypothetical protein
MGRERTTKRAGPAPGAGLALLALVALAVLVPGDSALADDAFVVKNPAESQEGPTPPADPDDGGKADPRIVGGSTTTIQTYPWQVSLAIDSRFGSNDFARHVCGGELLTSRIVQTAAHCVFNTDPDCGPFQVTGNPANTVCTGFNDPGGDNTSFADPNDIDVTLGRTTLSASGGEELNTEGVYMDGRYNPGTDDFDLAWIGLSASSAQPTIKIAGPDEGALWAPGAPSVVSGWGATSSGGPGSPTLKAATTPIIPDSTCGSGSVYGSSFHPATMVCAGVLAGGTDSCQGDSGGPLQAPGFVGRTPVQRLVGVVSWGVGCASPNRPGVYVRIASPSLSGTAQGATDFIEADLGLADAGPVVGSGAKPTPTVKKKKCKKGKRLKKNKCVKKKRKKKSKKKRRK